MKHTDTIWYPQVALSSPVMVQLPFWRPWLLPPKRCPKSSATCMTQGTGSFHPTTSGLVQVVAFHGNARIDGGPRWGKNMQTWAKDGKRPQSETDKQFCILRSPGQVEWITVVWNLMKCCGIGHQTPHATCWMSRTNCGVLSFWVWNFKASLILSCSCLASLSLLASLLPHCNDSEL